MNKSIQARRRIGKSLQLVNTDPEKNGRFLSRNEFEVKRSARGVQLQCRDAKGTVQKWEHVKPVSQVPLLTKDNFLMKET